MNIIQHTLNQAVAKVAGDWAKETIAQLKSAIEAKDVVLTGNLKQSLSYILENDDDKVAARLSMIFTTYGRFQDMKSYQYKVPPTKAMYDFVKKVGLDGFSHVNGYPKGIKPIGVAANSKKIDADEYVMKRIARSIAFSRMKKGWASQKQKEWWNITIRKRIGILKNDIRVQLEKDLGETIRQEFNLQ
jgi:hypothetical protein